MNKTIISILLSLVLALGFSIPTVQAADDKFATLVSQLGGFHLREKEKTIEEIAKLDDERVLPLLVALLHNVLYQRKSDNEFVIGVDEKDQVHIHAALTGKDMGLVASSKLRRVVTNNQIRGRVRTLLAVARLHSKKSEVRQAAADELIKSPDKAFLQPLDDAIGKEKDGAVLKALKVARAVILIDSPNEADRLQAVQVMDGYSSKEIMTLLEGRLAKNDDGSYVEPSARIRSDMKAVLTGLQREALFYKVVQNTCFGLSLGSVLLLAAVGLAITFGVMGVINMAHGEMIMLGAYTTYVVQLLMPDHIGASLFVAIPAAFLVSGLVGILIERLVIRYLYGRPLETLLATFGISLFLQQLVRTVFSPLNRSVQTPDWMSGSWHVNGFLSLTYNRIYIVFFSLLVLFGLMLLLKKSFFGLQMRAVTQNRAMASAMGIRTGWVDALTFGLGSGIAGIAGVALSQLTNVGPNLGQSYIIDSFMVVVFGGVGNLWGTFVAAMGLGIANKYIEPLSGAVLAKILVLVFIILFIQRRPRGLFALKGRFVEG